MKKLIGKTGLDGYRVKVYVTDGIVSHFIFPKKGKPYAEMSISIAPDNWWRVMGSLFHEVLEGFLAVRDKVYDKRGTTCVTSDTYLYVFDHGMLDEVAHALSTVDNDIYNELHDAWKAFHKPKKKETKKGKKKK